MLFLCFSERSSSHQTPTSVISLDRKTREGISQPSGASAETPPSNLVFHILFHLQSPSVVEACRWWVGRERGSTCLYCPQQRLLFLGRLLLPHLGPSPSLPRSRPAAVRCLPGSLLACPTGSEMSSFHLLAVYLGHRRSGARPPRAQRSRDFPSQSPRQMTGTSGLSKTSRSSSPLGRANTCAPWLPTGQRTEDRWGVPAESGRSRCSFCPGGEGLAGLAHPTARPLAGLSAPGQPIWAPPSTLPSTPFSEPNPWFGEHGRFP